MQLRVMGRWGGGVVGGEPPGCHEGHSLSEPQPGIQASWGQGIFPHPMAGRPREGMNQGLSVSSTSQNLQMNGIGEI